MSRTFVIVGGSIAGLSAAEKLRELTDERIVMIDRDSMAPYDRTALSKDVLVANEVPNILLRPDTHLDRLQIEVRRGIAAVGLDAANQAVRLSDGTSLRYDRLLIATGTSPIVPFPRDADAQIHVVRTHADAMRLRAELRGAKRVAVIGAGLVGCEVASAARQLGIETAIVDLTSGPFQRVLGDALSTHIEKIQLDAGVATYYGRKVADVRLSSGGHRFEVELSTGEVLAADIVVAGTGVMPETGWLDGSSVDVGQGVVCDSRLKTSLANVFSAGDVASWPGGPGGGRLRLEHWANAAEQGAAAAVSMASAEPSGSEWTAGMPHFMSIIHSHRLSVLGHTHGGDADDPDVSVAVGPDGRGLIALYGDAGRLVGCATVNQPKAAVRLSRLFDQEGSWSAGVAILHETFPSSTEQPERVPQ